MTTVCKFAFYLIWKRRARDRKWLHLWPWS